MESFSGLNDNTRERQASPPPHGTPDTVTLMLSPDAVYQWISNERISFKGFFFDKSGRFLEGPEALTCFQPVHHIGALKQLCSEIDGFFSVIIREPDCLMMAVDPMRSFPLFYTNENGCWTVSDSSHQILLTKSARNFNEAVVAEFRSAGFVLGKETLVQDLYQVRAGETICLDLSGKKTDALTETYDYFLPLKPFPGSLQEAENALNMILQRVTRKLLLSSKGKTLVLPLSGGFDSRLIACMLKKAGAEKVVCLTYGRPNPESVISKKVAEQLGYKWLYVNYAGINYKGFLDDPVFQDYCQIAGQYTSMPYLQEYFAIKHLKEHKLVPDDSLFLPGHLGDNLGGSNIHKAMHGNCDSTSLPEHIMQQYFTFLPLHKHHKKQITSRLEQWFRAYQPPETGIKPVFCPYIPDWDMKERLPKFVFNSATVFPCFGYGVRFPLLDKELKGFFRDLPLAFRQHKALYKKVLIERYFKPMHVFFGAEEPNRLHTNAFKKEKKVQKTVQWCKRQLKRMMPQQIAEKKMQKNDWICYREFSGEMLSEMRQKKIRTPRRYYAYNALICEWYIMKTREMCKK